jgi:hypothetical protein
MTLIVSLRNPDGIVIAGDSLSTMMGTLQVQGDLNVTCPQCGHQHTETATLPGIPMPSSTLSYAQKVFPFMGDYGVGTFGIGQLVGKTIYFAIRELEKELANKPLTQKPGNVTEAAKKIGERALALLKEQTKRDNVDTSAAPDDWRPLGFQVVGYDGAEAKTIELAIGKDVRSTSFTDQGATVSGQTAAVAAIFSSYAANPQDNPNYAAFSLQDAIAYAEFLISTTANYQQFSQTMAGVGGETDIALVTPFDHFVWIRQKSLQSQLAEEARRQKGAAK